MLITVKTLKQETFRVEVDVSDKVELPTFSDLIAAAAACTWPCSVNPEGGHWLPYCHGFLPRLNILEQAALCLGVSWFL